MPFDEAVDMPYLQLHLRLAIPAVLLALQEVVEEALLQQAAVVRIKVRPVLDAVNLEPFFLCRGADETLQVAARVQTLSAPVGRRKKRGSDLLPDGGAVAMILIVERMGVNIVTEVAAILRERGVRKRFIAADRLPRCARARATLAQPLLHGLYLHVVPVGEESAEYAAVVRHVAVPIGRTLPDAHGGKMTGLQGRDVPLVHAVIRDPVQADLAVRPRLSACPFDTVVEVLRLARREVVYEAG